MVGKLSARCIATVAVAGLIAQATPAEVMAASWAPTSASAFEMTPLATGALGVAGASSMFVVAAPEDGQSQSQSGGRPQIEGGQSQTQSGQSQTQALPDPDDDLEIEDDPFFADEPGKVPAPAAPAPTPTLAPEVIEIEVPDGYGVEVEIVDGSETSAPAIAEPAPTPMVISPTPAIVPMASVAAPVTMTAVELRSRRHVPVERFDDRIDGWVHVCVAPCRAQVPAGSLLRVPSSGDHDVSGSRVLRLDRDDAAVSLDIHAGSRKQRRAGFGLAAISASGVATGAIMVRNTATYADPARRSYEGLLVVGMAAITLVAGVGMALAGKTRIRESRRRVALLPNGVAF